MAGQPKIRLALATSAMTGSVEHSLPDTEGRIMLFVSKFTRSDYAFLIKNTRCQTASADLCWKAGTAVSNREALKAFPVLRHNSLSKTTVQGPMEDTQCKAHRSHS